MGFISQLLPRGPNLVSMCSPDPPISGCCIAQWLVGRFQQSPRHDVSVDGYWGQKRLNLRYPGNTHFLYSWIVCKYISKYVYTFWQTLICSNNHYQPVQPTKVLMVFPESVWAQGSSNSGGLYLIFSSSHLLIFTPSLTPSHFHICSSSHLLSHRSHICSSSHLLSHLLIFTSAHLHICSSSHLLSHLLSSAHLHIFSHIFSHICSSSHLLIFTSSLTSSLICSSSHLLIFTSAHLHIFSHIFSHICSSSHLLIFTSSLTSAHLHICSSSHLLNFTPSLTSSHLHIFSPFSLLFLSHAFFLSFSLKAEGGAGGESRNVNPFARNEGRSAKTEEKLRFDLSWSNPFARNEGRSSKTEVKLRFDLSPSNPFARNEGRSAKTEVKLRVYLSPSNPFARNEGRSSKTEEKIASLLVLEQPFRTKWRSIVKKRLCVKASVCKSVCV